MLKTIKRLNGAQVFPIVEMLYVLEMMRIVKWNVRVGYSSVSIAQWKCTQPCSCLMWKLWTRMCQAESIQTESVQTESKSIYWVSVNTTPCPKCHRAVEKVDGCNTISCICGESFCWLCGEVHENSLGLCAIGKIPDHVQVKDFYRYRHYYNSYVAHEKALKLEKTLKDDIQNKILILERKKSACQDFTWATSGLCRLLISRRFLTYSYPFAYYMFRHDKDGVVQVSRFFPLVNVNIGRTKKNIRRTIIWFKAKVKNLKEHNFQHQQLQLQTNVEKLSELINKPFHRYSKHELMDFRMKVINLSEITDRQCKKMYEYIDKKLVGSFRMEIHNIPPYHDSLLSIQRRPSFKVITKESFYAAQREKMRRLFVRQPICLILLCAIGKKTLHGLVKGFYRYMHCYNSYVAHEKSLELEKILKDDTRNKILILERKKSACQDFSWVTTGVCRLLTSRTFLTQTYPFSYFMFGINYFIKDEMVKEYNKRNFQRHQLQLQGNVEKLSELINKPFHKYSEHKLMDYRMEVINLSEITDRQYKEMKDFIDEKLGSFLRMKYYNIPACKSNGVERA